MKQDSEGRRQPNDPGDRDGLVDAVIRQMTAVDEEPARTAEATARVMERVRLRVQAAADTDRVAGAGAASASRQIGWIGGRLAAVATAAMLAAMLAGVTWYAMRPAPPGPSATTPSAAASTATASGPAERTSTAPTSRTSASVETGDSARREPTMSTPPREETRAVGLVMSRDAPRGGATPVHKQVPPLAAVPVDSDWKAAAFVEADPLPVSSIDPAPLEAATALDTTTIPDEAIAIAPIRVSAVDEEPTPRSLR